MAQEDRGQPILLRLASMGLSLVLIVILASCPRIIAVWLEPQEVAWTPVFGISLGRDDPRSVGAKPVRIINCDTSGAGSTEWALDPDDSLRDLPVLLTYGVAPEGFLTAAGPTPLRPGRYCFQVSGGYQLVFTLDSLGFASAGERPGTSGP
mgnify:FL=1|jgi:hypothetical protein